MAVAVSQLRGAESAAQHPPIVERAHRSSRRPSVIGVAVFAVLLLMTVVLAVGVRVVNDHNESRLLRLQTRQTGILLQLALQGIQLPLASAAEIAASTNGASPAFGRYVSPLVATGGPFVSVSLWKVAGARQLQVADFGTAPRLATTPSRSAAFLASAVRVPGVGVIGLLTGPQPRLGFSIASPGTATRYVVYAETALPKVHRTVIPKSSPFADLRFALYLGKTRAPSALLATSEANLPLHGRTAQTYVPFGSVSLTLVAAPVGPLGGRFSAWRWWVIAVIGSLVAVSAGLASDRLVKRRRNAERLANEIEVLLADQRTIAESLQRALLPKGMPSIAGLNIAVRYLPGVGGIEIGGDWYDVIAVDDTHFYFVVGDVSGRGLVAGSVMASVHFAIRAFVSEGHEPAAVLNLLAGVLQFKRDKHFATVLCGFADIGRGEITIANAGHLPPLVINGDGSAFVATPTGPPIGVSSSATYTSVTLPMTRGATLLAYTDGLVERRGVTLDEGLHRLRAAADSAPPALEEMLSAIVADLIPDGAEDDTALLGLQWT